MIKSLGFLCGSSFQVYPFRVGLSLIPLPKTLAKLLRRSLRNFLMLTHNNVFASNLIFPRISRMLWKSRLGLKPSLKRFLTWISLTPIIGASLWNKRLGIALWLCLGSSPCLKKHLPNWSKGKNKNGLLLGVWARLSWIPCPPRSPMQWSR